MKRTVELVGGPLDGHTVIDSEAPARTIVVHGLELADGATGEYRLRSFWGIPIVVEGEGAVMDWFPAEDEKK